MNFASGRATVAFDPERVGRPELAGRIIDLGYRVPDEPRGRPRRRRGARRPSPARARRRAHRRRCWSCRWSHALHFTGWEWCGARARDARRVVGRVAVPPRGARERAARRDDDGHARVDRHARGVRLVGRRARCSSAATTRCTSRRPAVIITLLLLGRYFEAAARGRSGRGDARACCELGAKTGAARERRRDPDREPRGRRPLRRAAGREDRHRRPRRRRRVARSTSRCSPASPSRSRSGRATRCSARRSTRRAGSSSTATRVGADTALAQIAALVEQAQGAKAPVQRLADRISSVFVPIVLVIAALTLAAWLVTGHSGDRRVHRRGRGADHRLPVRARPGDADGDHGRYRSRRAAGHRHQGRRRARGDPAHRQRRRSTRPAPSPRAGWSSSTCRGAAASTSTHALQLVGSAEDASEHPIARRSRAAPARGCGAAPRRRSSRTMPGSACGRRSTASRSSSAGRARSTRSPPELTARDRRGGRGRSHRGRSAGWDGAARGGVRRRRHGQADVAGRGRARSTTSGSKS